MLISTGIVKPLQGIKAGITQGKNSMITGQTEVCMSFFRDLKIALRSLSRAPALWITVALTLALGIGANAAIFSVVRTVLLRPLANRDKNRLLYLRQSAPGIGDANTTFSVPEIQDLGTGLKTIQALGTFSAVDFTLVGLGTPRELAAG